MAHPDKLIKDGRTFDIFNKEVAVLYINNDYKIQGFESPSKITKTSYLILGKLIPIKNKKLCSFVFRWDEKASTLDIDPENCKNKKLIEKFNSGHNNDYYGHHPEKINSDKRSYKINIVWESIKIFEGIISFSLGRKVESITKLGLRANIIYKLLKGA